MKFKTTQKNIKSNYNQIISVGYCGIQSLLRFKQPIAYTTRSEGWGCDIYDIDGVAITTGYAPFGQYSVGYKLCQKYETLASEIDYNLDWDTRKELTNELLEQFISEVLKH